MRAAPPTPTTPDPRSFQCMECGRRLSTRAAERAAFGDFGCPGCGGSDIGEAEAALIISYGSTPISRVTL